MRVPWSHWSYKFIVNGRLQTIYNFRFKGVQCEKENCLRLIVAIQINVTNSYRCTPNNHKQKPKTNFRCLTTSYRTTMWFIHVKIIILYFYKLNAFPNLLVMLKGKTGKQFYDTVNQINGWVSGKSKVEITLHHFVRLFFFNLTLRRSSQ